MAERILANFGTLGGALRASSSQLREAGGDEAPAMELLLAARHLVEAALRDEACEGPIEVHDRRLLDLVRLRFAGKSHECVLAIYFDGQQRMLLDKFVGEGCGSASDVTARAIFSRAFACDAAGVILAHNHPSGDWLPSRIDVAGTEQLRTLAKSLGIELFDHLIVAGNSIYSMREGRCV